MAENSEPVDPTAAEAPSGAADPTAAEAPSGAADPTAAEAPSRAADPAAAEAPSGAADPVAVEALSGASTPAAAGVAQAQEPARAEGLNPEEVDLENMTEDERVGECVGHTERTVWKFILVKTSLLSDPLAAHILYNHQPT